MIQDRSHIHTELHNPRSAKLDILPIADAVRLMHEEDQRAVAAVGKAHDAIAKAVEFVAHAFRNNGRLIYFGAGTSGRLGVLDAAECPPTFCSDPAMVVGVIAGGDSALKRSIENVEDDRDAGAAAVRDLNITANDVAFGIAAGGTTPFVHGALLEAKSRNAKTVFLICTDPAHVAIQPDLFIPLDTGPEVLRGSTRLKAGTATKLVLNTVTTLAMVQIGKTYGNLMVDVDSTKNAKLVDRGARIISTICKTSRDESLALIQRAGGNVKRAIVMQLRSVSPEQADQLIAANNGHLRKIVEP